MRIFIQPLFDYEMHIGSILLHRVPDRLSTMIVNRDTSLMFVTQIELKSIEFFSDNHWGE